MAKQDRNKNLNILAMKIANLEKEMMLGKNVKDNAQKIEMIMNNLSNEDLLYVASRISDKNLIS